MFAFIFNFASFIISVAFPIFASYKALASNNPALIKPWLTYWLTFTVVSSIDAVLYPVYSWIPLFSLFKLYFFVWFVLPQTRGYSMVYHAYVKPVLQTYDPIIQTTINDWQSSNWVNNKVDSMYSFLAGHYYLSNGSSKNAPNVPRDPDVFSDSVPLSTLFFEYVKDTVFSTVPAYLASSNITSLNNASSTTASNDSHFENSYTSLLLDQFKETAANEKSGTDSSGIENNGVSDSSIYGSWGYSILASLTFSTIPRLADTINGTFMKNDTNDIQQQVPISNNISVAAANSMNKSADTIELSKSSKRISTSQKTSSVGCSTNNNTRKFSWSSIFKKQQQNSSSPLSTTSSSTKKNQRSASYDDSGRVVVFVDDEVKLSYNDSHNEDKSISNSNNAAGYTNFGWVNVTKEKVN